MKTETDVLILMTCNALVVILWFLFKDYKRSPRSKRQRGETQGRDEVSKHQASVEALQPNVSTRFKVHRILFLIALLVLEIVALIWISDQDRPPPVTLGTVQKITYVPAINFYTQIDTDRYSLLVRGVSQFQRGVSLERRSRRFSSEACMPNRDVCEELMGK